MEETYIVSKLMTRKEYEHAWDLAQQGQGSVPVLVGHAKHTSEAFDEHDFPQILWDAAEATGDSRVENIDPDQMADEAAFDWPFQVKAAVLNSALENWSPDGGYPNWYGKKEAAEQLLADPAVQQALTELLSGVPAYS